MRFLSGVFLCGPADQFGTRGSALGLRHISQDLAPPEVKSRDKYLSQVVWNGATCLRGRKTEYV